jgi:hypothetical protein
MKLNEEQTAAVRTAALMVIDAMTAVCKECEGTLTMAPYLKEKIQKAAGWLRIAEGRVDEVLKEANLL